MIREDLKAIGLAEDMDQDRKLWRDRIKILDHGELAPQLSLGCSRVGWVMVFRVLCLYAVSTCKWEETCLYTSVC